MSQDNILVVDDDLMAHQFIKGLLEMHGYINIEFADSGEHALEQVKKVPPDLILLDISMPGIGGIEVCKKLKSDSETSHIPIIIVTGSSALADELVKKSFDVGATDFLTKPIRSIEFLARVKSCLNIKQNHDQLMEEFEKRKKTEKKNEELISELTKALTEIKVLSGLLPICSHCKKIRDDKGHWNSLEGYIQEHTEAKFSHGICRECAKEYYPDLDIYAD